jgi:hypothetical protein
MQRVAAQRRRARFDRVKVRYDEHFAAGHLTAAEVLLRQLLALSPDWAAGWYDLGLIAKIRRDWAAALAANERAVTLGDGKPGDPAAWNLGIAATARDDWPTARRAWAAYGLDLPAGTGPIDAGLGLVPIRLNPPPRHPGQRPLLVDGSEHPAEVVWAERLSPAHAVLAQVPLPDSGHRYGDVVLHDGEPAGTRDMDGQPIPVFDELARLVPAVHATTTVTVTSPAESDTATLLDLLADAGLRGEDWTASLRAVDASCAESTPAGSADTPAAGTWPPERSVGIAGDADDAVAVLDRWAAAAAGRSWRR